MDNKDVISEVAAILQMNPRLVEFSIGLDKTDQAFAMIISKNGDATRIDIDVTQLKEYERILQSNGVEVDISFFETFP